MAMAIDHVAGHTLANRASDLIAAWRQARADHKLYVETRESLERLTDADLADIGISRLNIAEIAGAAVYRQ